MMRTEADSPDARGWGLSDDIAKVTRDLMSRGVGSVRGAVGWVGCRERGRRARGRAPRRRQQRRRLVAARLSEALVRWY